MTFMSLEVAVGVITKVVLDCRLGTTTSSSNTGWGRIAVPILCARGKLAITIRLGVGEIDLLRLGLVEKIYINK